MCLFRCPQTCWNQKNAGHITAVQHGSLQKMSFMEHEIPSQTLQISSFFRGKNPLIFQELDPHLDPPCGSQQSIQQKKRNFSTKKWNKRINVYIQNSSSGGVCLFWLCFVYLFGWYDCFIDWFSSLSLRLVGPLDDNRTKLSFCVCCLWIPGWKVMEIFRCFKLTFDMYQDVPGFFVGFFCLKCCL